ncbi:alpha-amylase [Phycicoccus sp. CSK15P-2]|uniref:alpha-amylase family glycosyl hydrolase n=1 Tax=Phycicoccus sp. CSK15P-2 TaxID=2807627 RepID=UPI0019515F17|nr:alpha-amylase family glycosyl hydrolase [Phycicoccus sp. CSK15P-2]MBM6402983.1 alpha-amylase [Phycicoccus sp. CSK15P-2]
MNWVEHVIWWHVYPLGFLGADTTGEDRTPGRALRDLEPWLDHLVALGANGLALGPVFDSATHGYDTTDWFHVDPRLGTDDDLVHLVEAAHARGVRVMLDGVFNHVGPHFPALVAARRDPAAPERALFRIDDGDFATFEGHGGLVALDHDNPDVARTVAEVMTSWCERAGVDAWRLDAAYAVPPAFWAGVLPQVRAAHPDVWVVGEVIHGDYVGIVRDGGLDSVTQYELWQGVWHALQDVNLHELAWALQRHEDFLAHFVPMTFVGNHDVTRIASQVDDGRHHAHAAVLLLLLGGTPSLYAGDEYGLRAVKEERVGGDDAIRPAFPPTPEEMAEAEPGLLDRWRALVGLRRRYPWLHTARTTVKAVANATMVLESAPRGEAGGTGPLVVALNLGDDELVTPLGASGTYLVGADSGLRGEDLVVGAHGWAVAARG